MLGESISYYKSQLKHAAKSGPQLVTIKSVESFKDKRGKNITDKTKCAFLIKYENDSIEHDELYWIIGRGYKQLKELISMMKIGPIKELVGKQLWIVIRHNITLDQNQNEVKRESEIVHYSPEDKRPEYPQIFEQYDIAANA